MEDRRGGVSESASVAKLVDDVIQTVYDKYLGMNAAEYAALKQASRTRPAPRTHRPLAEHKGVGG
eukprot:scaffold4824_cov145-Isochrysis_galbana.AAC.1